LAAVAIPVVEDAAAACLVSQVVVAAALQAADADESRPCHHCWFVVYWAQLKGLVLQVCLSGSHRNH